MSAPNPYKIVVAASYPPVGRFIALALRLEGFETHLLADGEETLAYLLSQPFDAVLLDAELPRVDGLAICQRVRAVSAAPIVLFFMQGGRSQHWHARHLGASAVLDLPIGADELRDCVRALLPAANGSGERHVL
jgi:DNA-binding response OmpR family regulator